MISYNSPTTEYGSYEFSCKVPSFCPTEWSEECSFLYVKSGEGEIYIDGYKYEMLQGDIFILPPFAIRSVCARDSLVIDCATFNLRLLAADCDSEYNIAALLPFLHEKTIPTAIKTQNETYSDVSKRVFELLDTANDKMRAQQSVYGILSFLRKHSAINTATNITEEKQRFAIQTALTFIKTNYTTALTVRAVSEVIGYDEFYTMKLFKRFTGKSIIDYTNGYRIMTACALIKSTKKQISEIAEQVGYANVSYFNRQFKKYLNVTPIEYRLAKN